MSQDKEEQYHMCQLTQVDNYYFEKIFNNILIEKYDLN